MATKNIAATREKNFSKKIIIIIFSFGWNSFGEPKSLAKQWHFICASPMQIDLKPKIDIWCYC